MAILKKKTGTPPENEDDETDEGAGLDEAAVVEIVNKTVNKAISSHNKRLDKKLDALLARMPEPKTDDADGEDGEDGDGDATVVTPPKPAANAAAPTGDPRMDALMAQVQTLNKQLKKSQDASATEKAARQVEEKKRLVAEERSALRDALTAIGITDPSRLKAATAVLYSEEGRVKRDAAGDIVFVGTDADEDPLSIVEGIKAWAATDEGKSFLPPKGRVGSGDNQPTPRNGAKGKRSSSEADAESLEDAKKVLYDMVLNAGDE